MRDNVVGKEATIKACVKELCAIKSANGWYVDL